MLALLANTSETAQTLTLLAAGTSVLGIGLYVIKRLVVNDIARKLRNENDLAALRVDMHSSELKRAVAETELKHTQRQLTDAQLALAEQKQPQPIRPSAPSSVDPLSGGNDEDGTLARIVKP